MVRVVAWAGTGAWQRARAAGRAQVVEGCRALQAIGRGPGLSPSRHHGAPEVEADPRREPAQDATGARRQDREAAGGPDRGSRPPAPAPWLRAGRKGRDLD